MSEADLSFYFKDRKFNLKCLTSEKMSNICEMFSKPFDSTTCALATFIWNGIMHSVSEKASVTPTSPVKIDGAVVTVIFFDLTQFLPHSFIHFFQKGLNAFAIFTASLSEEPSVDLPYIIPRY